MQRYFSNKCENDYIYLNSDDMYHINKVMRKLFMIMRHIYVVLFYLKTGPK